jgi:hypothetical protein
MKPVSSTESLPIKFKIVDGNATERFRASSAKIGWLHSIADKAGAKFDIVIRDAAGRIMFEKPGFGAETKEFGEFLGRDVRLGEELEVSLENVKGADEVSLFFN